MIERAAKIKRSFLIAAGIFSLAAFCLVWFLSGFSLARSVFAGFMVGLFDNYIMFMGVEKGAGLPFAKAMASMKRNMFKRIVFDALAIFAALKAGISILPLFIAYIILHLVCLIFIAITAWREDQKLTQDAERSEKSVGKQNN